MLWRCYSESIRRNVRLLVESKRCAPDSSMDAFFISMIHHPSTVSDDFFGQGTEYLCKYLVWCCACDSACCWRLDDKMYPERVVPPAQGCRCRHSPPNSASGFMSSCGRQPSIFLFYVSPAFNVCLILFPPPIQTASVLHTTLLLPQAVVDDSCDVR